MEIKVIQVNIYKGRYMESLVEFLNSQKADIVCMQEVAVGEVNLTTDKSLNTFEYLKSKTGMDGVFFPDQIVTDRPGAHVGNAVLTNFKILDSKLIPLRQNTSLTLKSFEDPRLFPDFPRSIVEAKLDTGETQMYALSAHGAWTAPPVDTPETLRQAKLIKDHLKSLNLPFIFCADMNTIPGSKVIKTISSASVNQITGSDISRTTHPVVHKTASFKPEGLLVDYIFSSKDFKKVSVEAPNVLVTDHLPVVGVFELGV